MTYTQYRYYSVIAGMHVSRLSVRNEHGDEVFVIVPQSGSGAQNRAWRTKGLDALEAAVAADGTVQGEITISED